jgi:hypothetical protein
MDKNRKLASALALVVAGLGGIVVVRLALEDPKDLAGENAIAHAGTPQRGHILSPERAPREGKFGGLAKPSGTSMTMDEKNIVLFQDGEIMVLDRQTLVPVSYRNLTNPPQPVANANVQTGTAPEAVAMETPYTE